MREDLARARKKWIDEAKGNPKERAEREASDTLTYQNEDGFHANFHAHRHAFISNLGRAGVLLATAQKLARHSDPKDPRINNCRGSLREPYVFLYLLNR